MKLLIEKIPNLQALYIKQLRLLLSAEEMIAIKMQFLTESAMDPQLQLTLRKQAEESEANAARLGDILSRTGRESAPIKCKAIYALFNEAEEFVKEAAYSTVRDVVLIAATQKIKHYEIAAYGAVRQFARVLDYLEDERLLNESILEKNVDDKQLSSIAERVNPGAKAA